MHECVDKINKMVSDFKEIIFFFQNNFIISLVIPKCKIFLVQSRCDELVILAFKWG